MNQWIYIPIVLIIIFMAYHFFTEKSKPTKHILNTEPKLKRQFKSKMQPVVNSAIRDFTYRPENLKISPGTSVIWTNYDNIGHTVTSDDGHFLDSPLLQQGDRYQKTFNQKGTYPYHCVPHPWMMGIVMVK